MGNMTKLIIIQPALPHYRLHFFDSLSKLDVDDFSVVYPSGNLLNADGSYLWAKVSGPLRKIFPGLYWQVGVMKLPVDKQTIVVVAGAPRCITNILFLFKAKLAGASTVWWGHLWSSTSKRWRFFLRLRFMNIADAVLFYTDKEASMYSNNFLKEKKQLCRGLNNGIDTSKIELLREEYESISREKSLLFIGRLTKKSNITLLIRALSSPMLLDVKLYVIGTGEGLAEIQRMSDYRLVKDRVIFLGGIIDEVEIAKYANVCRLFVYPGEVGLSLVHGMAYGLPAIVHSNSDKQMPEFSAFQENITGRPFEMDNCDSLSIVIYEMINDTQKLNMCSNNCVALINTSFNTEDMTRRFRLLIDEVCLRSQYRIDTSENSPRDK